SDQVSRFRRRHALRRGTAARRRAVRPRRLVASRARARAQHRREYDVAPSSRARLTEGVTPDPGAEYARRLDLRNGEMGRADRLHALLANTRLALAAAIAVLAWQAFVSHRVSPIWPIAPVVAFAAAAVVHVRVIHRMERARRARQLYERGVARLTAAR